MIKALGLLSGGLDSTLAVKLMINSGIKVTAINFVSPFCLCSKKGCQHQATRISRELGIKIKVFSKGEDYLEIVKNPKYGYGKNMNPCIDCRIFMLKKTKRFMDEVGASFIFTGEVLGQRPMSQRKKAMLLIERESGLEGLILRPLSAKLLIPTIPEKYGWVNREKLLNISGRGRKPQFELVKKFNIKDYTCPAGGCRLTDSKFALRLKESFSYGEDTLKDIKFLKYGRHFRLAGGIKVIVGRNEKENLIISNLADREDWLIEAVGGRSPLVYMKNKNYHKSNIETAVSICLKYGKYNPDNPKARIYNKNGFEEFIYSKPLNFENSDVKRID